MRKSQYGLQKVHMIFLLFDCGSPRTDRASFQAPTTGTKKRVPVESAEMCPCSACRFAWRARAPLVQCRLLSTKFQSAECCAFRSIGSYFAASQNAQGLESGKSLEIESKKRVNSCKAKPPLGNSLQRKRVAIITRSMRRAIMRCAQALALPCVQNACFV